jgi:anti-anti-sigma factor
MPESKVLMTRDGVLGIIKIVGVVTFQKAAAFKTDYLQLISSGVREFVVDLTECEQLDSTFLGMILGLGLQVRQLGFDQVHVIGANEMITKLFRGTGLDQLFDMSRPGGDYAKGGFIE